MKQGGFQHARPLDETGAQGFQLSPTAIWPERQPLPLGSHPLGSKPTHVHVDPLKPYLLDLLHGEFVLASIVELRGTG